MADPTSSPPPAPPAPAPSGPPADPPVVPPAPTRSGGARPALQRLVETLAVVAFLVMAVVPLARFGLIPITEEQTILILALASVLISVGALLFGPANFSVRRRAVDEQLLRKYRRDLILTSLSVGGTVVVALMLFLEGAALLAFLGFISRTSEASIAFADNYLLFATFTILFCSMLLIARTSFETRTALKTWHAPVAYALLALTGLVLAVGLLVNYGLLTRGAFADVQPRQSVYIVTLGILFQIIAFKLLLRYPAVAQLVVRELDAARRANKEVRDQIQKRAYRAYFVGLAFVLLSFFLVGGIATQNVVIDNPRTLNFIIILYLIFGGLVLGVVITRYFQHKYIAHRAQRQAEGDVIAKKRISREEMTKRIVYGFSIGFGTLFALIGLALLLKQTRIVDAKFGTDFLILAFLVGVGPYGVYRGRHLKKIRRMDDKFPDFLRDLAESERAGMTLPRALMTASKGVYGALTPEIKQMSAQVEWGVSFTEALTRFADRVNTPLIQRTVALIVEASRAGGNVVDILTAASDDAREIKQILEDRSRQMGIYGIIIYLSFFVFMVVVFVLAAQFLPAFDEAAGASTGTQVGGATIQPFDPEEFKTIFFHAALIQGIGGGLISGIMQAGHPLNGLKHSVIMAVLSWIFFRVLIPQ